MGRYNAPSVSEVEYIWKNGDGEPPNQQDIRCYPRNDISLKREYQQIKITSPHLNSMAYPLFFIIGGLGWHSNMNYHDYQA